MGNFDLVRYMWFRKSHPKIRKISGTPPLTFKSNGKALKNYRIYGQTSRNLFDMKKFAETAYPTSATINYSGNSLIFTPTENDAYVNQVYSQLTIPVALRSSCINVQPLTTYTISMNAPYKCFISWINDSFDPVAEYTQIPNNQTSYTFTTPSNCTKLLIRLGKAVTNIGDTFTISNIMLNLGSTALPYEPYGESVGDLVTSGEHAGEYKVPVTVSNGTDTLTTPIYLPEQIRKVGDEAEYIDYGEQKQHRVRVNLSEVNEFSNSITDTSNTLNIWVQQGKNDSFVYPPQQKIFVITEPTAITTSITITNANDSIRIKHNGSKSDIVIDIVRGLSPGAYSVSFNVLNYGHTTVGGLVINNIMVNKGSTALPYEPYIENTELDAVLPVLPTITGTNTLSVGTEVKPSKIEITGRIKMSGGG